ncbi:unnamed protein product [Urochloa humidicola]
METTDLSALLPEDVLAGVLRRLSPRGVATCRCVCKPWRAVIDGHTLLRAELLPLSLAGILVNFHGLYTTEFFSRPSTNSYAFVKNDGCLTSDHAGAGHLPSAVVTDHCNGLLLIDSDGQRVVVNPATGWRAQVPPGPPPRVDADSFDVGHLVYDPTISPHYEVFLFPRFRYKRDPEDFCPGPDSYDPMVEQSKEGFSPSSWAKYEYDPMVVEQSEDFSTSSWAKYEYDPVVEQSEWPPSPCVLRVFSSKMERWEERSFIREGKAAGTIADMRMDCPEDRNAVYWREALYVHCQTDFVMR